MTFRCPTGPEIYTQVLALLPRGRAWTLAIEDTTSTIARYWKAFADEITFLTERLCALRLEFWCATHSETHDGWMTEYGLPDACDPFPDLCEKVRALGGATCAYYQEVAARVGWVIECSVAQEYCGSKAGLCALAGTAKPGSIRTNARLYLDVHLGESTAYTGGRYTPPLAGRMKAGRPMACPPNITALECLLARVVHAHLEIVYQIIEPPTYLMADDDTHFETDDSALIVA